MNRAFLEKCQYLEAVLDQTTDDRGRWSATEPASRQPVATASGSGTGSVPVATASGSGTGSVPASPVIGPLEVPPGAFPPGFQTSPKSSRRNTAGLEGADMVGVAARAEQLEKDVNEREFYDAYRMLGRLQTYGFNCYYYYYYYYIYIYIYI